jgi:hypothetical protein
VPYYHFFSFYMTVTFTLLPFRFWVQWAVSCRLCFCDMQLTLHCNVLAQYSCHVQNNLHYFPLRPLTLGNCLLLKET